MKATQVVQEAQRQVHKLRAQAAAHSAARYGSLVQVIKTSQPRLSSELRWPPFDMMFMTCRAAEYAWPHSLR